MAKNDRKSQSVDRMVRANQLYRLGLTLHQIGQQLEPPVSAQRAGQLLSEGARRKLFKDPRAEAASKTKEWHLVSDDVFEAMIRLGNRRLVARTLGVSEEVLKARFAVAIARAKRERRRRQAARFRGETIAEYRRVAAELGRNPTSADLRRTSLGRRITRQFGTYACFWSEIDGAPDYVRLGWRGRKRRRR